MPDQAKIYAYIKKLEEFGYRLGIPFVKLIEGKIKELRIPVSPGQYRIFFYFHYREDFYLLHGFLKKTQKTPANEIDVIVKTLGSYCIKNVIIQGCFYVKSVKIQGKNNNIMRCRWYCRSFKIDKMIISGLTAFESTGLRADKFLIVN